MQFLSFLLMGHCFVSGHIAFLPHNSTPPLFYTFVTVIIIKKVALFCIKSFITYPPDMFLSRGTYMTVSTFFPPASGGHAQMLTTPSSISVSLLWLTNDPLNNGRQLIFHIFVVCFRWLVSTNVAQTWRSWPSLLQVKRCRVQNTEKTKGMVINNDVLKEFSTIFDGHLSVRQNKHHLNLSVHWKMTHLKSYHFQFQYIDHKD